MGLRNSGIVPQHYTVRSRHSSVIERWAMGWMIGVKVREGMGILFFTTASRPALGLTQPPIHWLPGSLSF